MTSTPAFPAPAISAAAASAPVPPKAWRVLVGSTWAFTVCFMVWMMFAIIKMPIQKQFGFSDNQMWWMTALPVLSGSLIRVPLGNWTDKYGGRIVMTVLLIISVPTTWFIAYATQYWQFLVIGLLMGLAGGSFSVGTPYVSRWFPERLKGTAMGVFGAGNTGSAVNKFFAPWLIGSAAPFIALHYGWQAPAWTLVPMVYAVIMLITVIVFWVLSASNPAHLVPPTTTLGEQLSVMGDLTVLKYCLYYFIVFGGYVGLSLYLPTYFVKEYGMGLMDAGFLTACFALPGGVVRAIGGYLSDKFGAHRVTFWVMVVSFLCLIVLSIPGPRNAGDSGGLNVYIFTTMLFLLGIVVAIGKASVFKYIGDEYPKNVGAVSGAVGLAGGMGGFVLPLLFNQLREMTNIYSTAFMLMLVLVGVALVWMYFTEMRHFNILQPSTTTQPRS